MQLSLACELRLRSQGGKCLLGLFLINCCEVMNILVAQNSDFNLASVFLPGLRSEVVSMCVRLELNAHLGMRSSALVDRIRKTCRWSFSMRVGPW